MRVRNSNCKRQAVHLYYCMEITENEINLIYEQTKPIKNYTYIRSAYHRT